MPLSRCLRIPVAVVAAWALFSACANSEDVPGATGDPEETMDMLVSAEWLNQHLDDPNLVVLDCTVLVELDENGGMQNVNGRANYESGHIPSAGFADLMGDLSNGDSPLEFAVPTPEEFAGAMGKLGVGDDSRVVLYDAYNSAWAARVWWMLRWIGFDQAALLDGGIKSWTDAGRPLSTDPASRPKKKLTPTVRPELIADRDEVFGAIENKSVRLIDSMPSPHYRGEMSMYARPGHITSAENRSVMSLVDETGRYRSKEALATVFPGDRDTRAITYCGGGIAASSNAFIMTRLGFTDVAVYAASLQEWAADPDNPMEIAPEWDWPDE